MQTIITATVIFTILNFFADREHGGFDFSARSRYGIIDYQKKTASRYHFIPGINQYMGNCFQIGNRKLAPNIAIFSLKEILTCITCHKYGCDSGCYAIKASRQYKTAYNYRLQMTYLACNHLDLLEQYIREDLDKLVKIASVDTIRIHEAGDFINQDYVNMWSRIVKDYSNRFDFYCYTKTAELFDFSGLMAAGCAVNNSVIDGGKNYGTDEELNTMKKNNPGLYICTYGTDHALQCGKHGRGGCRHCMTARRDGKMILTAFHDHGDDAEKTA